MITPPLKGVVADPFYFGEIDDYLPMTRCERVVLDIHGPFRRRERRNKTRILTAAGPLILTVPVKPAGTRIARDASIEYQHRWVSHHKNAVQSAYGRSPYFEHYFPMVCEVLDRRRKYYVDLAMELIARILKWCGIGATLTLSDQWVEHYGSDFVEYRGYALERSARPRPESASSSLQYRQVFGDGFVTHLSILDALMCCGPDVGDALARFCDTPG